MNFEKLHFRKAPKLISEIPGPKSIELVKQQEDKESNVVKYPKTTYPLAFEQGKGGTIKDVDGNVYIDFFCGVGVLGFGHANPYILKAAQNQLKNLVTTLDFPTPTRQELVNALLQVAPNKLKGNATVAFGSTAGTDAIEAAIKLAQHNTKGTSIISFTGGYHGVTSAALAATSEKSFKENLSPRLPNAHFMPYPYCYRCPFGKEKCPECGLLCLEFLKDNLENPAGGITNPSAFVIEAIQGEGGIVIAPREFLQGLEELSDRYEIPLIIDEVQSGFCRTGKIWGCEHAGVTPDIMTFSKAAGGIGLPLAGLMFKKELDKWEPGAHVGTFRGHQVAMAAGKASLDFVKENNLLDHIVELESIAKERLTALANDVPNLGEVRIIGLFIGLEFVKDKKTKEPAPKLVKAIQDECCKNGLLIWTAGNYGNVVRFLPSFVLTKELFEKGLGIFEDATKTVLEKS